MNANSPLSFLGNVLWILFGGLFAAIGYVTGGLLLCLSIVGIPFGLQCFKLAGLVISPFGLRVENDPYSMGCLSLLFNVIWACTGGLYTAFVHLGFGLLLCATIVGIPFGMQHFKLMRLCFMPFGKRIVSDI